MEPCDVINIKVDLETSTLDSILFQKQTRDTVSPRECLITDSSTWFSLIQDGLNYVYDDGTKSLESTFSEKKMCTGTAKEKDVSKEECNSAEGLASPTNSLQMGRDLSADQYDEQMTERTRLDSTISTRVRFIQLRTEIDPILASCFMCEMRHSQAYRQIVLRNLSSWYCSCRRSSKGQKRKNGIRLSLDLKQSNLFKMEPDIQWSKKMLPLWLGRVAMEDSFSWLSTLGGAYSALGDDFLHFAEKAGRVSIHQMKLACQIGDPILLARCRVYMAQSLMQKGFIHQAMFIVRAQYCFAISLGENTDRRLINMCKGVWSIIQYLHRRNKEHRKNGVGLHPALSEAR